MVYSQINETNSQENWFRWVIHFLKTGICHSDTHNNRNILQNILK